MPLHIGQVDAEVSVTPPDAGALSGGSPGGSGGGGAVADRQAIEALRPIVLEILREELERLRRQQG